MPESKTTIRLAGALAMLGASLGVSPAAQAQEMAQPTGVESNQSKVRGVESNQQKVRGLGRGLRGLMGKAGAVVDTVRNPSAEGVARTLQEVSTSRSSHEMGRAAAPGGLASLKLDAGAMSIAQGGILRCEVGQDLELGLIGEDASMQRAPLEPLHPKAHSTNSAVVRAAMSSGSDYVVNVRCGGDGEAWVVADAGGQRAVYPVLVGRARKQATLTTQPPAASGR